MIQILELQDGNFLIKIEISSSFKFSGIFKRVSNIPDTYEIKEEGLKININLDKK